MSAIPAVDTADAGDLLAVALSYAHRGMPVFPCKPSNKAPYVGSGFKAATTDETQIKQWWQQFPKAMIGIPTGAASGIWALDPDAPEEPGDADGRETLHRLIAEHGPLPITHTHETPGGGFHYCFKWHGERPIRNAGALDQQGINVRGEGGYIIAPPSRRADGMAYRHLEPLDAFTFAEAPEWLYDLLLSKPEPEPEPSLPISQRAMAGARPRLVSQKLFGSIHGDREHKYAAAALTGCAGEVAQASRGGRNNQLNAAAFRLGTMAARGWISDDDIRRALFDACDANGLSADDGRSAVANTIKSGLRAGWENPHADLADRGSQAPGAETERGSTGISIDDFVAYMPASNAYIFKPTREIWPAANVNAHCPPMSDGGKEIAASTWLTKHAAVAQMTWAPGEPMLINGRLVADGGWIVRNDITVFNLYRPPIVEDGNAREAGHWLDHINRIYPNEADHIVKWLAHRVQKPHDKINHALVFGGAQGIGKDTVLQPIKDAIGPWNFAEATPQQMLGRFNGFLKSVILRVSEARDLGDIDRFAFYDHLKAYTAAPPDVLRVDEKNIREHAVFNVVGVIITSNHKTDGIYLPADDRRHFVAWSDLTKGDFSDGYWRDLWGWYARGGTRHVAAYLRELDIAGFDPKAPPPKTAAFYEIVDANRAPEDAEMSDTLATLAWPSIVTLDRIIARAEPSFGEWMRDRKNARRIPHRLEACGYVAVRNPGDAEGRWKVGGRRHTIYGRASLSQRDRLQAAFDFAGTR